MASTNADAGKNYSGTFAGGEEKSKWKDTHYVGEDEPKGPFGGEGKRITRVSGQSDSRDGAEEKGFSLQGKDYQGPENWTPVNKGTCNPDDIKRG